MMASDLWSWFTLPGYHLVDACAASVMVASHLHIVRLWVETVKEDFQKGAAEKWAHLHIINTNVSRKREVWLMVCVWVHYPSPDPLSSAGIVFSGRSFEKAAPRQLSSITDKHASSLSAPSLSLCGSANKRMVLRGWSVSQQAVHLQTRCHHSRSHLSSACKDRQNKSSVAVKAIICQLSNVEDRIHIGVYVSVSD